MQKSQSDPELSLRYSESQERIRALESMVENLQRENAALKSEPDSSEEDPNDLREESGSVLEEVSNVDTERYDIFLPSYEYIYFFILLI